MTARQNGVGSRKYGLRPTRRALRREAKARREATVEAAMDAPDA